jgi:hypothetical protein
MLSVNYSVMFRRAKTEDVLVQQVLVVGYVVKVREVSWVSIFLCYTVACFYGDE